MTAEPSLNNWLGCSNDKKNRVLDGLGQEARLNEPNGCFSRVSGDGEFLGLYIADTGNNCIRFAHPDGYV